MAATTRQGDVQTTNTAETVPRDLPSGREQRLHKKHHLFVARWNDVHLFLRRTKREVEMWPKGALFCCLSLLLLPSLAHRYWVRGLGDRNPISRMRSLGAL